jgi:hypothetical protein
MKITIFGADGRTGVEVVSYAKALGFDVVAFVYNEASNKYFPENISIKKGDVMDYDSVLEAVRGSEAVISVLGHIKGSDPLMQTKGMANIVRAMKEVGIKRVLSLTGTGARVPGDTPSFIDKFLNLIVGIVDPNRINDGVMHVKVLQESGLDFTIVRVLKLNKNDKEFKNYKLTDGGPAELQTSRKKVAKVLVDLINDTKYLSKLPVISG